MRPVGESPHESEARIRVAMESAPVPIWISGVDGGCLFANKAALDFFGATLLDLQGFGWTTFIHPDDELRYVSAYREAVEAGAPFRCQARFRNTRGEYRWLDSVGNPRFSASGEFLGYTGASPDIDENKRFELNTRLINEIDLLFSGGGAPDEIAWLTTHRLGEYLGVGRCHLNAIDVMAGTAEVPCEWEGWLLDVPSVAGVYRLEEFLTPEFRDQLRLGQVAVIDDVRTDPRTRAFAANYLANQVASFVAVPARKENLWEATVMVSQPESRQWRADEVQLIRDVATRLWLAVTEARAVDALRRSEEQARRTLAEQMMAGVAECDTSGRFTMINQRYCDITGYSQAELLEMRVADITHPDDWPENAELFRKLFATGESFLFEKRYRQKSGASIWVNTHVSPIRDARGGIAGAVNVAVDLAARKRIEQELAAAKDRLAADLSFMTRLQRIGAIFVREGDLPAALTEVMYTAVAISDADRGIVQLVDQDSQTLRVAAHCGFEPSFLEAIREVRPGCGACGTAFETGSRVIIDDVTQSPLFAGQPLLDAVLAAGVRAIQSTPVLNRVGELIAIFSTYYETPRSPDERALRLLDLLAREIADIIERAQADTALRGAYEQAEAATRSKDEFLAMVSHELRNPLNSILGYAHLLRQKGAALEPGEIQRMLAIIERNGKTQLQLIEDLLDTGRIISGKLKLEVAPLNLVNVINAALDVVRPAVQAKRIELRATLDSFAGQITGDSERLQQVVWNLLSNAIKFTPGGGRVDISLKREDPHVQIVVRDTGKGIEPDFLPHMFERFRQSDTSSARRVGGLGLGLPLVKHLVELHGGTVEAQSAGADRGASFTVRLPVRAVLTPPEERRGGAHALSHSARSLAGRRVLVVDDEEDVRTLLCLTLERYGAEVEAEACGRDALARLGGQTPDRRFDILFCDIGMPEEDGYAVIRRVRATPPERGGAIPAIALTAYGRPEDRVRALEAGFHIHLVKPVDPDELAVVAVNLLARFRAA
jgi:PAS domain S-box-containing protein